MSEMESTNSYHYIADMQQNAMVSSSTDFAVGGVCTVQ
jgi:hypothetical protein